MALDDALDCSETNTSAGKLVHSVQTLKRLKQLPRIRHVKAGAIIPYEIGGLPVFHRSAKLDSSRFTLPRKFEGVFEEVLEHYYQQALINLSKEARLDHKLYLAIWLHLRL